LRSLILGSLVALLAQFSYAAALVVAVSVDGVVHPVTVEILSRSIEQAQREHAAILLVRLNTPGGLQEAMRECIQKMIASPIPVVTSVTPSGGRAADFGRRFRRQCSRLLRYERGGQRTELMHSRLRFRHPAQATTERATCGE